MQEDRREKPEYWHISRTVPLAFITALLIQTGACIWGAATLAAKLDSLAATVVELKADRYTTNDARRDLDLLRQKDSEHDRRLDLMEKNR